MMAPRKLKRAISKILVNQRRNEPPGCHRLAYYLAFTKSAQEPNILCKMIRGMNPHRRPFKVTLT